MVMGSEMRTYEGQAAASRASLSLFLTCQWVTGDDVWDQIGPWCYGARFHMIIRCTGQTAESSDWRVGIGETLAAATERESKLRN